MAHHGVDVDVLSRKLNQMLVLLSHCQFNVPSTSREAEELMETALELNGLKPLVEKCAQVLIDKLSIDNAIQFFQLGEQRDIENLSTAARNYILANFMTIYKEKQFLELRVDHLLAFLRNNELKVESEENVFDAIMVWIRRDLPSRKAQIQGLAKTVRLVCCDLKFLKTLTEHYLLYDKDEFQNDLRQIVKDKESGSAQVAEAAEKQKRTPRS